MVEQLLILTLTATTHPSFFFFLLNEKMGSRDVEWEKLPVQGALRPPPRWKHTANLLEQTKILLFAGFNSTSERLNDLWVSISTGSTSNNCSSSKSNNNTSGNNTSSGISSSSCCFSCSSCCSSSSTSSGSSSDKKLLLFY